ncbi:MAG: hypothetical protein ACYC69_02790 [Thermodesulfovibrionales bacterium]
MTTMMTMANKKLSIKRIALTVCIGYIGVLFIWAGIGFSQGFTNTRIGLISPEDGPCIFENTRTASEAVMKGERVPVHVVNIHYGLSDRLINGHLYAGDVIDITAPPTGIRERFSFTATGSIFSTLASVRRGPEWRWTEITTVAAVVGTYGGHLRRLS